MENVNCSKTELDDLYFTSTVKDIIPEYVENKDSSCLTYSYNSDNLWSGNYIVEN
jgi:hypothetical protein